MFSFLLTKFYEGYGQTECTAGCSLSLPGDWTAGMVGRRAIFRVSSLEFAVGMLGDELIVDWFIGLLAQQCIICLEELGLRR